MTGPTRPLYSIPLSGILAIAGVSATLCVLAIPPATTTTSGRQPASQTRDQAQVQRDATANLEAVGAEVGAVFGVLETVADTAVQ